MTSLIGALLFVIMVLVMIVVKLALEVSALEAYQQVLQAERDDIRKKFKISHQVATKHQDELMRLKYDVRL